MGGSVGKSSSDSNNQSSYDQDVWSPQGDALQGLYSQLGNIFNQTSQGTNALIPSSTDQMQGIFNNANNAWNQQLGGGAYQGMDLQGNYNNALQGGGNEQFMNESIMGGAGNDYVDAMKSQMTSDSNDILNQNLNSNDLRATSSGLPGSSRHGITEGQIYQDSSDALMDAQTQLGYQTFDKDLDRKMDIARNADAFDLSRLQSAENMLGASNASMQGGLNFGESLQNINMGQFAPNQMPWQNASSWASILGNPTVLGSGYGSGDSSSKGTALGGGAKGGSSGGIIGSMFS